jgi:hypothetical protein
MNTRCLLALAALVAVALPARAQNAPQLLSHDVYFSLNDASPAARDALVAACKKYLTGHPGVVAFSAGVLASELDRPVNDRDFDVALHMVFDGKASHDKYQDAPRHKQFIEENQKNWKKVRVFDSLVDAVK